MLLWIIVAAVAALAAAAPGPTLVVRGKGTALGDLAWVGVGCRVAVLANISEATGPDLEALAMTGNLTEECANVNALGLSSDGLTAIVAMGGSPPALFTLMLEPQGQGAFHLVPGPTAFRVPDGASATRISDAAAFNGRDVFFAAMESANDGGGVVALFADAPEPLAAQWLGAPSKVNDARPTAGNGSVVYATASTGLVELAFSCGAACGGGGGPSSLSLVGTLATPSVDNDGLAITVDGTTAFIAAMGEGFVTVNLAGADRGACGGASVPGFSGGVASAAGDGTGSGSPTLALVAADPGLVALDVADPLDPLPAWSCGLGAGSGGVGWNLWVDDTRGLALVADFDGGLQVVRFGQGSAPVAVAHFGAGALEQCTDVGGGAVVS